MDPFDNRKKTKNYYTILGCAENSSIDQIMKEYKIRAVQCHPDKSDDYYSAEKFTLLHRAKEVLTDPTLKKEYDSWLKCGLSISFDEWIRQKNFRVCRFLTKNTIDSYIGKSKISIINFLCLIPHQAVQFQKS
uniref:J domain-containing protein n=1 Tax=Romanomermis culicivorax TaxID=13658 RepID=A0A915K3S7_ROMCU